jgi:hypothetical protein
MAVKMKRGTLFTGATPLALPEILDWAEKYLTLAHYN